MAERRGSLGSEPQLRRLLALDSATQTLSVALMCGERCLSERSSGSQARGASGLLALIDQLLSDTHTTLAEITALALSIGPGSFTALRVGVATLKGLAFGSALPVAPISTLAALAWSVEASADVTLVPLLDARRGEAYAALYKRRGSELCALLPDGVYTPSELAGQIEGDCALVGEGAPLFGEQIGRQVGPGVRVLSARAGSVAQAVGVLGARCIARGDTVSVAQLAPRYLRRAEAEVKRTKLRFEGDH